MTEGFWWRESAQCRTAPLAEVDAAFDRPASKAAADFRETYCTVCPVWRECLDEAMATGEAGVWGGSTLAQRTRAGSPSYRNAKPDPMRVRREAGGRRT